LRDATSSGTAYCRDALRRGDRDRYLAALFAPADRRDDVVALGAFNLEIARAREQVSEPMLGLVRLQWWREVLDQAFGGEPVRRHPVAEALVTAIRRRGLSREPFDRLLAARERDMESEPFPDLNSMAEYAKDTTSPLLDLVLQTTVPAAGRDPAALQALGTGYAMVGLIRAVPFHAAAGRVYLPTDRMGAAGLTVQHLQDRRAASGPRAAILRDIARQAGDRLSAARPYLEALPRAAAPVRLAATMARWHLDRLEAAGFDPFDPRVQATPPWTFLRLGWRNLTWRL